MAVKNLFTAVEKQTENRLTDMGRGGEAEMHGKSNVETYITMYKIGSQQKLAVWLRKLRQGLCINLEGRDGVGGGGRFKRKGMYVYLWLIHVEV